MHIIKAKLLLSVKEPDEREKARIVVQAVGSKDCEAEEPDFKRLDSIFRRLKENNGTEMLI